MAGTLFDEAVEAVLRLPADTREDIALAMLSMARDDAPAPIDPEHRDSVLRGLAQAERREFVSDAAVSALFRLL